MPQADRDATRRAFSKPAAFVVLTKGLTLKTELTAARLRELLHYDPETGVFTRRTSVLSMSGRSGRPCQHAGTRLAPKVRPDGYLRATVDGKAYMLHRLAWLYMTGEWPRSEIDHVDGNRAGNAFRNLREATRTENNQNRHSARRDSASRLLGAFRVERKGRIVWRSGIRADGRMKHLGYFETPLEAHEAYRAAKRLHHPSSTLAG